MALDCDIIRDLLPSYIDKLTSEKSNIVIQAHLADCTECQKILSEMQQEEAPPIKTEHKKIDYLKTYKKKSERNVFNTAIVTILIAIVICLEFIIHLLPLNGATKSDLKDYATYPVMEVHWEDLEDHADRADDAVTYRIAWTDGNPLQNAVVRLTYGIDDAADDRLSVQEISVSCHNVFFQQAGSSINIIDGVIYVQVTGYRRTLFYTGGPEQFGFAVKLSDNQSVR